MPVDMKYVSSEVSDGVAVVTLNRPEKRNAVSLAMWMQLAETFHSLAKRSDARVAILVGEGDHFCAGADISEFGTVRSDLQSVKEYDSATEAATLAIRDWPGPTVAAISGYAMGGGCGLALACDFRVADSTAKVGISAARLGIVYSVLDTELLYRQVGLASAKRILFSGKPLQFEECVRIGLVDLPASDRALLEARRLAKTLVDNAPLTIAGSKVILEAIAGGTSAARHDEIDRLIANAYASNDYREGRAAFLEKRLPQFQGC
jgi:enoyl-CoA hydratase/carnithine racemase